ncbi:hypothetical protein AAVH_41902, partial [Aphelenchoides avenae]
GDWRVPLAIIFAISLKYAAMCAMDYAYAWCLRVLRNASGEEDGQLNGEAVPTLMIVD